MSDAVFTISQLCGEFDTTPRSLRFYESRGLLSPLRQGNRRQYSARDRARLILILRGKRFGMSLSEIGELLDLYDLGDGQVTQLKRSLILGQKQLQALRAKKDELTLTIVELEDQLDLVSHLLSEREQKSGEMSLKKDT